MILDEIFDGSIGLADLLPDFRWQEASVSPCMGLFPKLLTKRQLASRGENDLIQRGSNKDGISSPHLRSDMPPFLPCSTGHTDQPWLSVGGDCVRV